MSPDEFNRLVQRVLALRSNQIPWQPQPPTMAWLPGPIVRRVDIGRVLIECHHNKLVQVSIRFPELGRQLTVFAINPAGSFTYRDEYVDAVGELQRLIILDALAEA